MWIAAVGLHLVSGSAWAGCKVEDKKDLDGSSVKTAYMFDAPVAALGMLSGTSGLLWHAAFYQSGQSDVPLEAGGIIKFLLEDGTTFQLTVPELVAPKTSVIGTSTIITAWNPKLPVTPENVKALAASRIEAVELPTVGQPIRLDDDSFQWKFLSKKTQQLAVCWTTSGA